MWERENISVERAELFIQELSEMTDKFLEISESILDIYENLGCNIDILCRAIDYLIDIQAIPNLRGNFAWFEHSLLH